MKCLMHARAAYLLLSIPRVLSFLASGFNFNYQRRSISTIFNSISQVENCNWDEPLPYSSLTIGVSKENGLGEKRVAVTPESASRLIKAGFSLRIEKSAGLGSNYRDSDYEATGAKIVGFNEIWNSDIVVKVQPPTLKEAQNLKNRLLISFIQPSLNAEIVKRLAQQGATVFAMDCVPRYLSRAQPFDALSSQATVAGYRAVVECMYELGRFLPPLGTPAGEIPPAKVVILGAGVAGVAAISAAKNMGAEVYAYDVRDAVKDQVEAAGGIFLQVPVANIIPETAGGLLSVHDKTSASYKAAEREALSVWLSEADIVITTAIIPGKQPPKLITWAMVNGMKPGSVILDMAASVVGGNCDRSIPQEIYTAPSNRVKVIGYTDLPSRMATATSTLYANNMVNFLLSIGPATNPSFTGKFYPDYKDPAVREMMIMDKGDMRWPNPNPFVPLQKLQQQDEKQLQQQKDDRLKLQQQPNEKLKEQVEGKNTNNDNEVEQISKITLETQLPANEQQQQQMATESSSLDVSTIIQMSKPAAEEAEEWT